MLVLARGSVMAKILNEKGMLPVNAKYIRYLRSKEGKASLRSKSKKKFAGPTELSVYIFGILSRASEDDYTCFPSLKRIAEDCGCSIPTAQRAVNCLENMGWIEIDRTYGVVNRYKCTHFLNWVENICK